MENQNNETTLNVTVNRNYIKCKIFPRGGQNLEFAFYLKKDGVRIKTIWYTSNPECSFILDEDGEYSVVGFIRGGGTISILEAIGILYRRDSLNACYDFQNKTVNIFGSCVSRDLLEFGKETNFSLKSYSARSSVVSVVSEAVAVEEDKLNLASNFQKKQVFRDLSKGFWQELAEHPSDYLIIDFIDERFSLGKYENSYFTESNEFVKSQFLEKQYAIVNREKIGEDYYVEGVLLTVYLENFLNRILQNYTESQVILHRAKHVDKYISKKGRIKSFSKAYLQYNQRMNEMLDYMYDYVEKRLPGCISLDFHAKYYADENHKWGLSTMHYEQDYYIRVLNELASIIKVRTGEQK